MTPLETLRLLETLEPMGVEFTLNADRVGVIDPSGAAQGYKAQLQAAKPILMQWVKSSGFRPGKRLPSNLDLKYNQIYHCPTEQGIVLVSLNHKKPISEQGISWFYGQQLGSGVQQGSLEHLRNFLSVAREVI